MIIIDHESKFDSYFFTVVLIVFSFVILTLILLSNRISSKYNVARGYNKKARSTIYRVHYTERGKRDNNNVRGKLYSQKSNANPISRQLI